MAIDIYGKRNELQKQYEAQQKRLANAGSVRNARADQERDHMETFGKASQQYYSAANHAEAAARGAQSAETAAARDEVNRYKKLLEEEDSRLQTVKPFAELQEKQEMRAKEFRTAFPSILDSKLGHARTDMRRQIAEGVGKTRAGYNQRGLLYSGMRAGDEADVGREAEDKLAETAASTQQELMSQANQLDQDAIDTGIALGNINKEMAGSQEEYRKGVIDMLLKKDEARQQAIGGLLGTGATVAGYGLGAALK